MASSVRVPVEHAAHAIAPGCSIPSSWCDMVWHHFLLGNREGLKPLLLGV